jgi:DNA replication protein DnaC
METISQIKEYARELNLTSLATQIESLIEDARRTQAPYSDFSLSLLEKEILSRRAANLARRLKSAQLPIAHDLDQYNHAFVNGITPPQLKQLRELIWLDQNFNLMLIGASGTSKTMIAGGLCYEAIKQGYKALFRTMDQITQTIKMKDITTMAAREYTHLLAVDLLVLDDIMMFPLEKEVAVGLFQLINHLHEKASFIITTNKSPKEWAEMLDDEVLATAILDRLLYKCEVIRLKGNSYRLENRKTFFNENKSQQA